MHTLLQLLFSLLSLPLILTQNLTSTNGIGSTPADRHYVTASQAQTIINAATTNATAISIPQNIAVVDPSGLLVAFRRMDNAYPGSIDISIKKARTAVLFNGLTSAWLYDQSQPGGPLYGIEETNGGLVVFGGGVPIYLDGYLIGGVGVSGGTVSQDVEVSTAGVMGLGATTSPN
ncbi:DUF336-domain-containing protein [Lindgomyces ingoldianus]|uniref:DUF336-domain-containing protein n=1 Tax=Lindgomyces ingoldianus TaxID=673940 RepID=A0ACB6QJJ7_9PLEO|nr:DUF336-domain-containing protein [Lindgomyces ingoldianus]KAF2467189.1 DUF336-domain-containing protein [Lindgomyces ingoldianus]